MRRQTLYWKIRVYCFKQAVRRTTGKTADWVKTKLKRLTWHVCKSLSPTKPYMKVCGCWTLTKKVFHLCQTRQYTVECSYDNLELPILLSTCFFRVYKTSHANKNSVKRCQAKRSSKRLTTRAKRAPLLKTGIEHRYIETRDNEFARCGKIWESAARHHL